MFIGPFHEMLGRFLHNLVNPHSKNKDIARREFILNVLLLGSLALSLFATISALVGDLLFPHKAKMSPSVGIIFLFILIAFVLSKLGKSRIISYILIFLYYVSTSQSAYKWGATMPLGLLTYALIIVMSGILIGSRFAFIMTGLIATTVIILIELQSSGRVYSPTGWVIEAPTIRDGFVISTTFLIIALVSWLFNRDLYKALERAHQSESKLRQQKQKLEIMVEKRTQELRHAQIEKIEQLHRFSVIGKSASGLFHDLVTPMALISLNLHKLKTSQNYRISDTEVLIERALRGIHKLQNYVDAARKQIQTQDILKYFSLEEEINQSIDLLYSRARDKNIIIAFIRDKDIKIYGNPIKFSQMITNLISNAIESYIRSAKKDKKVEIRLTRIKDNVIMKVRDWGRGIPTSNQNYIFEPLFTTKGHIGNTGIGLSISKDIVKKNFSGIIQMESEVGKGTTFTVQFPIQRRRKI